MWLFQFQIYFPFCFQLCLYHHLDWILSSMILYLWFAFYSSIRIRSHFYENWAGVEQIGWAIPFLWFERKWSPGRNHQLSTPSFFYTFHCWWEGLYSTAYFYLAQIKSKVSLCLWNLFSIIIYRNRNHQTNSYFVFFQRKGKTVGFLWRGRSRARTGSKH